MHAIDEPQDAKSNVATNIARHDWRAWPRYQQGRWGYILAWALGVPVPVLLLVYLLRGCT